MTSTCVSCALQLPAPSTAARPTPASTAAHHALQEEASRLPQCATSSESALCSPSPPPTRLRKCRYPPRFANHAGLTSSMLNSTFTPALLLSASSLLVAADQGDFTGQWNGEWQANSNGEYSHYYDDDTVGADEENRVYHMWKDDTEETMSPERFILYATISILSAMVFLFCLCHPECLMLLFARFRSCCCGSKKAEIHEMEDNSMNTEYVGAI